ARPVRTISVPKNAIAARPSVRAVERGSVGGGGGGWGSGGRPGSVGSFALPPGSPSSAIGRKPSGGPRDQSSAASRRARSKGGGVAPGGRRAEGSPACA